MIFEVCEECYGDGRDAAAAWTTKSPTHTCPLYQPRVCTNGNTAVQVNQPTITTSYQHHSASELNNIFKIKKYIAHVYGMFILI